MSEMKAFPNEALEETRWVAKQIAEQVKPLFPVAWNALLNN